MPRKFSFRHAGHFLRPPPEVVLACLIFSGPRAKKIAFTQQKIWAGRAKRNGPRAHFKECRTQTECLVNGALQEFDLQNYVSDKRELTLLMAKKIRFYLTV